MSGSYVAAGLCGTQGCIQVRARLILGSRVYLAHITLARKKDPLCINIRNPIPQEVYFRIGGWGV